LGDSIPADVTYALFGRGHVDRPSSSIRAPKPLVDAADLQQHADG